MDALGPAAQFMHDMKLADVPEKVVDRATLTLLDCFAVMVSGATEPRVQRMAQDLRARYGECGKSSFVTDGLPGRAGDAALLNATSMCLHVEDEGHRLAFGHVATYVLPAILAVAQETGASGRAFLSAFIAGYEITARLGMAFKVKPDIHPTGTFGPVGGAAAVARVMGLDAEGINETMNIAAPLTMATLWRASSEGATVRDLYSGWGNTLSVMAPTWQQHGFTACTDSVAEVLANHTGTSFDTAVAVADLGQRWELMGNYFKLHACCGIFVTCLEEAMALQRTHQFSAAEVEGVTITTFQTAASRSTNAEPSSPLAAKESLPASLALAFIHGNVDRGTYNDANVFNPQTRELAAKVSVVGSDAYEERLPERRCFDINVRLRDGRTLTASTEGRIDAPQDDAAVLRKYANAVEPAMGAEGASRLKRAIEHLAEAPNLDELTASLAARA